MKQLHIQTYLLRLSAVIILLGQLACGKEPAVPPDKGGDGSGTGTSVETLAGGESRILKEATSGKTPANIIILGDGFTKEDYTDNGPFYTAAKEQWMDYSVWNHSKHTAPTSAYKLLPLTLKNKEPRSKTVHHKNTIFSVVLEGGNSTGISGDNAEVFRYALQAQGINNQALKIRPLSLLSTIQPMLEQQPCTVTAVLSPMLR